MIKKLILSFCFICVCISVQSQKAELKFADNGSFKIIQFTDLHYKQGNPKSAVVIQLINEVLDAEKPDLVVFTGDVVWNQPAYQVLDEVFAPVIVRGIPWAYVFGNHDDELGASRQDLMSYAVQKPYCLAEAGAEDVKGVGNYILKIKDKEGKDTKALLYFMDSGAYTPSKGVGRYDWLDFSQVDWYRRQSATYTSSNNGTPYPALAFFHIPLPEYPLMSTAKKKQMIGKKKEKECNGVINTGMCAAMLSSGDVMGTFVGHDHNNDYIGSYYGIYLAYGRYSGGNTSYNKLGENGCRVITLTEGERRFDTYIRLRGGEIKYKVSYPDTFSIAP